LRKEHNYIIWVLILFVIRLYGEVINPAILPLEKDDTIILKHSGGYDLNNNNLQDIIGITCRVNQKGEYIDNSTKLVLLELRPNSVVKQRWQYAPKEGRFTDIKVLDLDGDGKKEFAAICSYKFSGNKHKNDWLYIFEEKNNKIVREYADINLKYPRVRAEYLDVGDFDNDGISDLLVSSGSPFRAAFIISSEQLNQGQKTIKLNKIQLRSGVTKFRAFAANINDHTGDEIVMASGQEYLEIMVYNPKSDQPLEKNIIIKDETILDLNIVQILAANLDGGDYDEIILPFNTGNNYLLSIKDSIYQVNKLEAMNVRVNDIKAGDLNQNGLDEIFYLSNKGLKIFRMEAEETTDTDSPYFRLKTYSNPFFTNVQLLNLNFTYNSRRTFGKALIIPYYNKNYHRHGLSYWLLEKSDEAYVDEARNRSIDEQPSTRQKTGISNFREVKNIIGEYSGLQGKPVPLATIKPGTALVSGAVSLKNRNKYDFTIAAGDTFIYELDSLGFSDLNNISIIGPGDIKLSPDSSQAIWATDSSTLGKNNIIFSRGKDSEIINLYINSRPRIIEAPKQYNILQIGETFSFDLEVKDKNKDAGIIYKMVNYPEGAKINNKGLIVWRPSFYQQDWHDFQILVSDGFDTTSVNFSIFVNHPVTIISDLPQYLTVGENLSHKINIRDNKGAFLPVNNRIIKIENRFDTEVVEFELIQEAPDHYLKKFDSFASSGSIIKDVYQVNHRIILVSAKQKASPPSEIVKDFFNSINTSLPLYQVKKQHYFYNYSKNRGPDNLYITDNGMIEWTPEEHQVGWNEITYLVSDGYFTDKSTDSIYVNYPPKIVHKPDTMIYTDSLWQYQVKVKDINDDQNISYSLINKPEKMTITPSGRISWRPVNINFRAINFGIVAGDGLDSDTAFVELTVNKRPVILSRPDNRAWTDIEYRYDFSAGDAGDDSLIYKAIKLPQYADFREDEGLLIWKPRSKQIGRHQVVLQVVDSHGAWNVQSFNIEVMRSKKTRNRLILLTSLSATAALGLLYLLIF